ISDLKLIKARAVHKHLHGRRVKETLIEMNQALLFQLSQTIKYFYRNKSEAIAKLVHIKIETLPFGASDSNLIVVGQALIEHPKVLNRRLRLLYFCLQAGNVGFLIQYCRVSTQTIASGASRLLIIRFKVLR